ncbi:MAG: MFS transporter, partial [Myxococcota bacterium]
MSLGAELSLHGPARNRIFAARQFLKTIGLLIAGVLGSAVIENGGREATRLMAFAAAGITLALVCSGTSLLPEELSEFQGRGGGNPFKAIGDVVRNRHARLFLIVIFIDGIGAGGIGALTPFVLDYVVGRSDLLGQMLGINMVATLLGIPLWLFLGRRFEKRRLLLLSMFGSAIGYGSVSFVYEGAWWVIAIPGSIAGLSSSCPNVLGYTLKSEIVDVDEFTTGDRKEGTYFAGWSFVNKLAGGIMIGLVGWALEWSGFDGQAAVQSDLTKTTMVVLMGGFPLVCFLIGAAIFSRFDLTEAEHARIRAELDARAADTAPV